MASWMIHLRVADALLDEFAKTAPEAFVAGSLAPDCGRPVPGGGYRPAKSVTHFRRCSGYAADAFYISGVTYRKEHREFYMGYYAHLVTDTLWNRLVNHPVRWNFGAYAADYGSLREFLRAFHDDWYREDFRYLREHPDFRAFRILETMGPFPNRQLCFYGKDDLTRRFAEIVQFYRGAAKQPLRAQPLFTREQADRFVEETTAELRRDLHSKMVLSASGRHSFFS